MLNVTQVLLKKRFRRTDRWTEGGGGGRKERLRADLKGFSLCLNVTANKRQSVSPLNKWTHKAVTLFLLFRDQLASYFFSPAF